MACSYCEFKTEISFKESSDDKDFTSIGLLQALQGCERIFAEPAGLWKD
jgi:hypothetical protein